MLQLTGPQGNANALVPTNNKNVPVSGNNSSQSKQPNLMSLLGSCNLPANNQSRGRSVPATQAKPARQTMQMVTSPPATKNPVVINTKPQPLAVKKSGSKTVANVTQRKSAHPIALRPTPNSAVSVNVSGISLPDTVLDSVATEGFSTLEYDSLVDKNDLKRIFGLPFSSIKALCKQSREQPSSNILENFPLPFGDEAGKQECWSLLAVLYWHFYSQNAEG